jgi:hypothetical protein
MPPDTSLGRTPSKHVPTKVHKGTLIKEKGIPNKEKNTPQGNKGIQTHEKAITTKEDNVMKEKEPQTIKGNTKEVSIRSKGQPYKVQATTNKEG